jgi:hypothetical protein
VARKILASCCDVQLWEDDEESEESIKASFPNSGRVDGVHGGGGRGFRRWRRALCFSQQVEKERVFGVAAAQRRRKEGGRVRSWSGLKKRGGRSR